MIHLISFITSLIIRTVLVWSPLVMGGFFIIITILTRIRISLFLTSIIVIRTLVVYLGGLIVIFTYFLSLQPNSIISYWNIFWVLVTNFLYLLLQNVPLTAKSRTRINEISLMIYNLRSEIVSALIALLLAILVILNTIYTKRCGPIRPYKSYDTTPTFPYSPI